MTEILFWLNVALTALLLAEGFWQRAGYLQVPFLSALIYAVWYLPQATVLLDGSSIPKGSLANVLAMSLLCLAAIWAGWRRGVGSALRRRLALDVPVKRLRWPTLVLTLFYAGIVAAIEAQPEEVRAMSQWTGPITILVFFTRVGIVSLVLSMAMLLRRRTMVTMALAGANILMYAAPLLIYFRRQNTFEFVITILLCLFFLIGKTVPRAAIAGGLLVAFAFINGVGQLRLLGGGYALSETGKFETRIPTLSEIANINWFDFQQFEKGKYESETRNAAIYMSVADDIGSFSFGAEIWNMLVLAYVPGQIVGFEFKESLKVGNAVELNYDGYETLLGTTVTGFAQPYRDFWFFGSAVFFFVTQFMGREFAKAYEGSLKSLCYYAVLLPLAILAITHSGYYLPVNAPLPVFAVWLAFRFAEVPRSAIWRGRELIH